jgi:hypothetical protein
MQAVGPHLMLPTMVMLWGLVTTMQGFIITYQGLLVCRFFLGLFEGLFKLGPFKPTLTLLTSLIGGAFPGVVLYLSFSYPRSRLNVRYVTYFLSA